VGSEPISQQAKRVLPDLAPLAPSLRALSLSGNRFTAVPACLFKLTKLEVLDLSRE
jgi:Leucine-rich repeat (LRR) protein